MGLFPDQQGRAGGQSLGGFPEAGCLARPALPSWQTPWRLTANGNPFLSRLPTACQDDGPGIAVPGMSPNQIQVSRHMKVSSEISNDLNSF